MLESVMLLNRPFLNRRDAGLHPNSKLPSPVGIQPPPQLLAQVLLLVGFLLSLTPKIVTETSFSHLCLSWNKRRPHLFSWVKSKQGAK